MVFLALFLPSFLFYTFSRCSHKETSLAETLKFTCLQCFLCNSILFGGFFLMIGSISKLCQRLNTPSLLFLAYLCGSLILGILLHHLLSRKKWKFISYRSFLFFGEILVCLILLAGFIKERSHLIYVDYYTYGPMMENENEDEWFLSEEDFVSSDSSILTVEFPEIFPHLYDLIIEYSSDTDLPLHFETFYENNCVDINDVTLNYYNDSATLSLAVKHPVFYFRFSILSPANHINACIKSIQLVSNPAYFLRLLICCIFLFAFVDIGISVHSKPVSGRYYWAILIAVFLSSLPYLWTGYHPGDDTYAHLMRIESLTYELSNGQFPVYFGSLWDYGHGCPFSLYYGDIGLYFPAFLRLCGFSIVEAYKLFLFFLSLFTAMAAFFAFNRIIRSHNVSLLLTMVYLLAPYRLIDLYVRSAIGECFMFAFFPLVFSGFYSILYSDETSRWQDILILAIGMSGLLTSHLLSFIASCFILLVIALINLRSFFRHPKRLIHLFLAAALTSLLSAFYLVPFIDSYLNNDIRITNIVSSTFPNIQSCGVQIGQLFTFFGSIFGDGRYNTLIQRFSMSPGILLLGVLIIAFPLILHYEIHRNRNTALFFFCSFFTLILSTNLFPWTSLAYYSSLGKLLSQIQFPWRFLGFYAFFATLLLGSLLKPYDDGAPFSFTTLSVRKLSIFVTTFSLIGLFWFLSSYSSETRQLVFNKEEIDSTALEYTRSTAELHPENYVHTITSQDARTKLVDQTTTSLTFFVETGDAQGLVTLPLNNYKGFSALDENGTPFEIIDNRTAQISLHIPANYANTITVAFTPLWYWKVGLWVSIITALFLIVGSLAAANRRHHVG